MDSSKQVDRAPLHTRVTTFKGFLREDGLFDLECELTDQRHYESTSPEKGTLPPESFVHSICVCLTLDHDLVVHSVRSNMRTVPFAVCPESLSPMSKLIGSRLGPGWRHAVESSLGDVKSCTHLRELLVNAATAAYQTIPAYLMSNTSSTRDTAGGDLIPPFHMGRCKSWDFNGEIVKTHFPQFVNWQPPVAQK